MRRLANDPRVDLWSLDEVHFQQHGSRCRMWVPPEDKDPVVLHHPTRRSVGYFGAVRLRDGKLLCRREEDRFNGETFYAFLKDLRVRSSRARRRVVLIIDNAGYHHAKLHRDWREEHAAEFSLEFLPPYSPELNPIERIWKLTRRECLHNCYFPSLEAITQAVELQFAKWATPNNVLRRLSAKRTSRLPAGAGL